VDAQNCATMEHLIKTMTRGDFPPLTPETFSVLLGRG
jgi:hypothetical protein